MEDSILQTVKAMLGITQDFEHFDPQIIMDINSVFAVLAQMGVGPEEGFAITGVEEVWSDFIEDKKIYNEIKSYMYMRVRMLFDPPTSSYATDAMNNQIKEFEWRLFVQAEADKQEAAKS